MPRARNLKPEFWTDDELPAQVPDLVARLVYMGLWNLADEHSRLRGNPRYIKGQLFAYDDVVTIDEIERYIDMLHKAGKAIRYMIDGTVYLFLPNLADHQRLEPHKVPSKLPAPPSDLLEQWSAQSRSNESARDSNESALSYSLILLSSSSLSRSDESERAASAEAEDAEEAPPPQKTKAEKAKRGTRIDENFAITPERRAWAKERVPLVDIATETIKFVNYWVARTKDATKLDWDRTWQNWMLNAAARLPGSRASPYAKPPSTAPERIAPAEMCKVRDHQDQRADNCRHCAALRKAGQLP